MQYERDHSISSGMLICVGIQLVYLTKFFLWETGYLCTLDIIHDRFGLWARRRAWMLWTLWPRELTGVREAVRRCRDRRMRAPRSTAGSYICWGFLCFVPSMYTSSGLFLVNHRYDIEGWKTLAIIAFGVYCTYLNWSVDQEKIIFRKSGVCDQAAHGERCAAAQDGAGR